MSNRISLLLVAACLLSRVSAHAAGTARTTKEVVAHFTTDDIHRTATHAVPLSHISAFKEARDQRGQVVDRYGIEIEGHTLVVDKLILATPKGVLTGKDVPPRILFAKEPVSGENLEKMLAKKHGFQIGKRSPPSVSRKALRASRLDQIEQQVVLEYTFNRGLQAFSSGTYKLALDKLAAVGPAGLGYAVVPKGEAPVPSREQHFDVFPWYGRFSSSPLPGNFYNVMGTGQSLSWSAVERYLVGKSKTLRIENLGPLDHKSGTQMADSIRAQLVRRMRAEGMQSVSWKRFAEDEQINATRKEWGL